MKTTNLVILGCAGLSLGIIGGLAGTGMLTPYLPGMTSPPSPSPTLKAEPDALPADDAAYLAFDQGKYLTALELAEQAA